MTRLMVVACVMTAMTVVTLTPAPAAAQVVRIVQTNSAGDNVHLIDPASNMIVWEITGVEVVHGVAAAPDGSRLYLSNESTETLDIVDAKTLEVTNSIPLSGGPNNLAIHENGRRLYIAIQGTGGGVEIIDTVAEENVRTIRILRGVHNTFITPDSKYVVAGGDRLGGPAPRGLYRFRVTGVTDRHIEIGEVEEDVLLYF